MTEASVTPVQTEISSVPADWQVVALSACVIRSFGGGTPSTRKPEYWDGDIPWTTSAIISDDDFELDRFQRRITRTGLSSSASHLAPAGSVLVGTRVGVGKAVVALRDIAINQDLSALVLNDSLDPYYLAFHMKLLGFKNTLASRKRGTTIKGIPREDLLTMLLPIPPLPEQRGIARVLRAVQRVREALRAELAALKQLKASLMRHLFTYGPVLVDDMDQVELQETEIGKFPTHWQHQLLGTLCKPNDGCIQTGPFGSQLHKSDYCTKGVGVVNPTHLLGNRISRDELPAVSTAKAETLKKHIVRSGDVLFARRGEIGRHGYVTEADAGLMCGTGCFLVRVNHQEVFNEYLQWFFDLSTITDWLVAHAAGAIMPNLSNTTLSRIPMYLPMREEQAEIARILQQAVLLQDDLEQSAAAIQKTFDSLLHNLMTGQLRIPRSMWIEDEAQPAQRGQLTLLPDVPVRMPDLAEEDTALLIALLATEFRAQHHRPIRRFHIEKLVYFYLRLVQQERLPTGFHRHAAGPYNPDMRYDGAEALAMQQGFIERASGSAFSPGPAAPKALKLAKQQFDLSQVSRLVKALTTADDNELELLATVDFTVQELKAELTISAEDIRSDWRSCPVWKDKLQKFTTLQVEHALSKLRQLASQFGR